MNMCFIYAHFLLNQRMEMATGEKVVSFLCLLVVWNFLLV